MYYRKIGKLGGSLYVGIPSKLRDELGLVLGDYMHVSLAGNKIIIERDEMSMVIERNSPKNERMRGENSHG